MLVLSTCELILSHHAEQLVELCISDDASQDEEIVDRIRTLAGPVSVSISVQPVNVGFSRNLIHSARMARGRYLAFSGDDDVFKIDSFPAVLSSVKGNDAVVLFNTLPDSPTGLNETGHDRPPPDTIQGPAEFLRTLGLFHGTFIGNFIIRRDLFLSQASERDVLSHYPHTIILLRILKNHPARYLPVPLLVYNGGGLRWNQALLSAIDLTRIFTDCFAGSPDKKILYRIYTRQMRSIPRAFLNNRLGRAADASNPHQSLALRNVLDCYRGMKICQIQAAVFWIAGRILPVTLLSAILGSEPAKVHFKKKQSGSSNPR